MKRAHRTGLGVCAALLIIVVSMLGAVPEVAAAGARKALRKSLDAELATFEQALAATVPVRYFCERELTSLTRRFEALRTQIGRVPARELDLEGALAQLQVLREELDAESARCRKAAEQQAERALDKLRTAVAAARERTRSVNGQQAAAPNAYLVECEELLQQLFPAMLGEGRYSEVISTAHDTVRRLELSISGGSCEDDFGVAEHRYSLGSYESAIELYCRLAAASCLERAWSDRAMSRLEDLETVVLTAAGAGGLERAGDASLSSRLDSKRAVEVAEALAGCMPDRFGESLERVLEAGQSRVEVEEQPAAAAAGGELDLVESDTEYLAGGPPPPRAGGSGTAKRAANASFLTLDVWQSAWGDFSDLDQMLSYLRRNHITEVFLNPGQAMKPDLEQEGYEQLGPLVSALRQGGVEHIQYLYAELNYDVGHYAGFLKRHPDLGISVLIDDSEFTDRFRGRFETNRGAVRAHGIGYAAFVTVEGFGNSGVSDGTRRWAIRNLDQTILMSYFSCSLEGQKDDLNEYLSYADRIGKRGSVKIALLMGGKKMGRELSCELELDRVAFQSFLQDLHAWARTYSSYGGIVLETNRRLPAYDVAKRPLR